MADPARVRVIVLTPHRHGGHAYQPGTSYEVDEREVEALVRSGRVRRAEAGDAEDEPPPQLKTEA